MTNVEVKCMVTMAQRSGENKWMYANCKGSYTIFEVVSQQCKIYREKLKLHIMIPSTNKPRKDKMASQNFQSKRIHT